MTTRSDSRKAGLIGLTIERTFDAPRELVFAAWTEQDRMAQWCYPKDFEPLFGEGDLRPGGKWRAGMKAPWGDTFLVGGVYREIVPPERLVFTHAWEQADGYGTETIVTITLFDEAGRTRMVFEQVGFAEEATRDSHVSGWNETFDHLQRYAERI